MYKVLGARPWSWPWWPGSTPRPKAWPGRGSSGCDDRHDGHRGLLAEHPDVDARLRRHLGACARRSTRRCWLRRGIRCIDLTPAALGPASCRREPGRAPRRARREPGHLRRAGDRADRGRAVGRVSAGALRGDRLHGRVAVGRARARARTSTSSRSPRRARWSTWAAPAGQGDHHPQPGRAADHDAQHGLRRARRGAPAATAVGADRAMVAGCRLRARLPAGHRAAVFDGAGSRVVRRGRGRGRLPAALRRQPGHHDLGRRPGRRAVRGELRTARCEADERAGLRVLDSTLRDGSHAIGTASASSRSSDRAALDAAGVHSSASGTATASARRRSSTCSRSDTEDELMAAARRVIKRAPARGDVPARHRHQAHLERAPSSASTWCASRPTAPRPTSRCSTSACHGARYGREAT